MIIDYTIHALPLCMSFKKSKHIVHKQFSIIITTIKLVVYVIQKK